MNSLIFGLIKAKDTAMIEVQTSSFSPIVNEFEGKRRISFLNP